MGTETGNSNWELEPNTKLEAKGGQIQRALHEEAKRVVQEDDCGGPPKKAKKERKQKVGEGYERMPKKGPER